MKKVIITAVAVVATGIVLTLNGCKQKVNLATPDVTWEINENQDGIIFKWSPVQDAEGYVIRFNHVSDTIEDTTFILTIPATMVEISAYAGNDESDPWTQSYGAIETKDVNWYTEADTAEDHPSGLVINDDGTVETVSLLGDEQDTVVDFVATVNDTISYITAIQVVDTDTIVTKNNGVSYLPYNEYDGLDVAPSKDDPYYPYLESVPVSVDGVFALLKDSKTDTTGGYEHYAKLKVKEINGTQWTVDITVQPIKGFRWLIK